MTMTMMVMSTLTTARVHKGQQRPGMVGGEQEKLTFEKFPHLGLFLLPSIFLNFAIKHMIFSTMGDT